MQFVLQFDLVLGSQHQLAECQTLVQQQYIMNVICFLFWNEKQQKERSTWHHAQPEHFLDILFLGV